MMTEESYRSSQKSRMRRLQKLYIKRFFDHLLSEMAANDEATLPEILSQAPRIHLILSSGHGVSFNPLENEHYQQFYRIASTNEAHAMGFLFDVVNDNLRQFFIEYPPEFVNSFFLHHANGDQPVSF